MVTRAEHLCPQPGPSVPGHGWFDSYSLRAQWAPVLTVIAPPIFAAYMIFPELVSLKGAGGGGLLVAALPPILAHSARNLGKAAGGWTVGLVGRQADHTAAAAPGPYQSREPTKRRYFRHPFGGRHRTPH